MTREQQVREALKLLAQKNSKQCRSDIEEALDVIESQRQPMEWFSTKDQRKAVEGYRHALKLADSHRTRFPATPESKRMFADPGQFIAKQIAAAEQFLSEWVPLPARNFSPIEKTVAWEALQLCLKWGHPPVTTHGGTLHKLAAILRGKPDTSLSRHLPVQTRSRRNTRTRRK